MDNKCGGKLAGERTRVLKSSLLTELCFADDAVIIASYVLGRTCITKATMHRIYRSLAILSSYMV